MNAILLAISLTFGFPTDMEIAKSLTTSKNYEESISILKNIKPSKAEYNEFCYLMAVNFFAINDKENSLKWIKNFDDSFEVKKNRRYQVMVSIMEYDIQSWKKDDLGDIVRDMKHSASKLETTRSGQDTQKIQKEIVRKLDKIIKEQEDAKNNMQAQGKDGNGNKSIPSQGQGQPAQESIIMGGSGAGKVDEKKLQQIAEMWGSLPPEKRAKVIDDLTRETPPKYKPLIDEYFKALNKFTYGK